MRAFLFALLLAAGIGLFGATSSVTAAPANGAAINDAADASNAVVQVQHWRWGSRRHHWRWGSRGGHWRWGSRGGPRCHARGWSRWYRC